MKKHTGYIILVFGTLMTLIGYKYVSKGREASTPIEAQWSLEQITGADMPELHYASEERIIFHGYFGLFVYDLNTQSITHSLDLKSIGCDSTQGDAYCEVSVSQDGNKVQLHPMISNQMYVYDIEKEELKKLSYTPMQDPFKVIPNENPSGAVSYVTVKFANGERGYLQSETQTLDGLYYVRGNSKYKLF